MRNEAVIDDCRCPCGGTIGRLRQFRCDRCDTVEGGHLTASQRVRRRAYTSYWAERSDIQGEKIAMYLAEY